MLTSAQLKQITSEARPIIERMLDDAERLAGLRGVVATAGGDWGQLKALIKAQIKDENDEAGDGKHVRKILDKADYATAYADMLGLSAFSKMNEENFFEDDVPHDADGVVIENGGRQLSVSTPTATGIDRRDSARSVGQTPFDGLAGPAFVEDAPLANIKPALIPEPETERPPAVSEAGDRGAATPPAAATVVPSNVTPIRTHNPDTHFLSADGLLRLHGCTNPEVCASSQPRTRLCFNCSVKHDGPTVQDGAA